MSSANIEIGIFLLASLVTKYTEPEAGNISSDAGTPLALELFY